MNRTWSHRAVGIAVAAALAVSVTACGGSSGSTDTTSASPTPTASATSESPSASPSASAAESVSAWAEAVYDSVDTSLDVLLTDQLLSLVEQRRAEVEALGATIAIDEGDGTATVTVTGDETCELTADNNESSISYSCF